MANTDLKDTAIVEASVGGSDELWLLGCDKDGTALTTGSDGAGVAVATGHAVPLRLAYKKDSKFVHQRSTSQIASEAGRVVGQTMGKAETYIEGTIYGSSLQLLQLLSSGDPSATGGNIFQWKAIDYEPASAPGSYLQRFIHIGRFELMNSVSRSEGAINELKFKFNFYELDGATQDTNNIGGLYYSTAIVTAISAFSGISWSLFV